MRRKEVNIMPSTYTHYYFGNKVFEQLPPDYQTLINHHRDLYDIGQHGPDILFYHYPLKENKIMRLGYDMHHQKGKVFFSCARRLHQNRSTNLAYLYGFICHFTLDAYCHPYVEKYIEDEGVSHFEIEMQLDRYLLEKSGFNVFKYQLSQHIHPSRDAEEVISPYFKITQPKNIHHALMQMNALHRLMHSSNDIKRWILYHGMDVLHVKKYKDQIISKYPNPKCVKSNIDLDKLINEAVPKAVELITTFVSDGVNDPLYEHTFGND